MTANNDGPSRTIRRSFNIPVDLDARFLELITRRGISRTEGFKQAVVVWSYIDGEIAKGHRLVLVDDTGRAITREIVLL